MAVMQTPQGLVIGLIPEKYQPKAKPVAEKDPATEDKVEPATKKPGRPPKK